MERIYSPITGSTNVSLEKTISTESIVEAWERWPGIDVSCYFKNLDVVKLYRCNQTGYRFYTPLHLSGDSFLYEKLQMFDWYYTSQKWEYTVALELIQPNTSVLEIGCGPGFFLKSLSQAKKVSLTGLELNPSAVEIAINQGLAVYQQTIENHCLEVSEYYDAICSFQVLEHITNIESFITSVIAALKPGGMLMVAVPNNNSFIKNIHGYSTNLPPHHMGLWDEGSLAQLSRCFPITLKGMKYEPLNTVEWYYQIQSQYLLSKIPAYRSFNSFFRVAEYLSKVSIVKTMVKFPLGLNTTRIPGHTILAWYQKNN